MEGKEHTCCFLGHRKIDVTDELANRLKEIIERLIIECGVETFLFGSKSEFDALCQNVVAELKIKYPNIKRIYVRAEFPYIDESYEQYLLKNFEHTYYPETLINAGRAVYVKRNCEMIDKSGYCIIYYDENYKSSTRSKSGTKIAYDYMVRKGLKITRLP